MKRSPFCIRLLCTSALLFGASPLHAALLVYEGFDGYTAGATFTGVMPNSNTVGLDTSVSYAGSGASTFTATATGLTMPGLLSSGGSATSTAASAVVAAKISSSFTSYTGTLYSSHLVSFSSRGTANGNGFEVRISDDTSTGGTGGNSRFRALADTRANTASEVPGVDYIAPSTGSTLTYGNSTGGALTLDTTFLVVASFANVGTTFTASNQGLAKLYAFTADQYQFMMSQADPTAYFNSLNAASVGTDNNQIFGFATESGGANGATYGLESTDFMQFVSVNDVATVDEIRFGSDFLSVVPIPEPGATSLAIVASAGFLLRRRRASC